MLINDIVGNISIDLHNKTVINPKRKKLLHGSHQMLK